MKPIFENFAYPTDEEVIDAILSVPEHFADLAITAANVVPGVGAQTQTGIAGETITAGQPLYIKASDANMLWRCDNDADVFTPVCVGIAAVGGSRGQKILYYTTGSINLGATLVVGETYVVSGNVGMIAPVGDLSPADSLTYLGYATTTALITLNILPTGVLHG
jgi:hypothetical protein